MRKQERETGTDTSSGRQSAIDDGIAKELDDSVSIRITNSLKDITLLELPEIYRIRTPTVNDNKEEKTADLPPLSRAEHYDGRIGRDMRHLAVSVVSSIDDVAEWQLFCEQNSGGLEPLIECIRDGATSIREGSNEEVLQSKNNRSDHYLEVNFQAASSACRALRNLCALSLDLAAVITDGLLRANTAYTNKGEYTLMEDLCTILRHADDFKLYVTQLLLAMTCASDCAVDAIRSTEGLQDVLLVYSSYVRKERRRRWMRYPGELIKSTRRQPFIEAASLKNDLNGRIQGTANQVLAAIGYNEWVPKIPGQKGLRILTLDGGGSRGMTSVVAMKAIVDSLGGMEIADCFDLVVGTSTGAIIAFLVGLNRETSEQAVERYDDLIGKIFTKSAFSTPMLLFTTATYDESPFMNVLNEILGDNTMLDSRANPAVPFVFAVTSKMSSSPTHIALFRNYNYNGGEQPDPFMIDPDDARENLGLSVQDEAKTIRINSYPKKEKSLDPASGSRHPGSFRVLQKHALRASTAAPTVFKPVLMGGEMYCDGGIVASNPSAIAIHEARNIFPDVPIELVVSIGTGGFKEQKSEPRIGWDGIIGQIINSATDGEQIHHILEDVLGDGTTAQGASSVSNTRYMRFNPILGMPDEYPIDVTDPEKLQQIKTITSEYMEQPKQQRKLQDLADILKGRSGRIRRWRRSV
ncbi:FabD/lysophospholipase-like protein [Fragilariopsis cylindrus CCMP1102]|uniref:FabD/lysophospholipase-like protein n=1 Tax=Fragilariopsis cylindrus CCMP1102 TaxID=635003 RepID=A0A1E7FE70_9STRA|nr:FabD/lysophospholipase-like protein [Fragilariopsis cylindrus CCMP1102]|eukprot:OEU16469.1 FabD/lysophospholipase-like protein [Fragilariopsis cylindrus CCMP1102]